jgi:hypothetical protein
MQHQSIGLSTLFKLFAYRIQFIVAKELSIAVVEAFDLCLHSLFDDRIRRDRLDRQVLYYYRSFRDTKAVV